MAIQSKKKIIYRSKVDITYNEFTKNGLEIEKSTITRQDIHCNVKLIGGDRQSYFQNTYQGVGYRFRLRGKVNLTKDNGLIWRGMDFVTESITPDFYNNDMIVEAWTTEQYQFAYDEKLNSGWLLADGVWDDTGIWMDSEIWID